MKHYKKIENWLKESVEWLKETDCGCGTYKLDDRLAICVGWLDGYDISTKNVIHSKSQPEYCINAGIKVWTSDDLRTDFEWINSPYYEEGDVLDYDVTICEDENYENLAKFYLKKYDSLKNLKISKSGKIIK